MHLDFSYHPFNKRWYRQINLLLYLYTKWKKDYKGHLKIEDLRSGEKKEISMPFNRLTIQECESYTLHGYEMTNFPEGNCRTSIATYAYTNHKNLVEKPKTTDWFPNEESSVFKKISARHYNKAVQIKISYLEVAAKN